MTTPDWNRLEELRQLRAEHHDKMQILVTKAEREKRSLRPDETKRFQALEETFDSLTDELRGLEERLGTDPNRMTRSVARGGEQNLVAPGGDRKSEIRTAGDWLAAEMRALTTGAGLGQILTPADRAPLFDFLAAESVGLRSGFTIYRTDKNSVLIPHSLTDATAAWTAENAQIAASDPTGESLEAQVEKLAGRVVMSNEVALDSDPSALQFSANSLLRSIALKLDLGFYEGTGTSPEIRGLKNVVGIQEITAGANGAAPTVAMILNAIELLETVNSSATAIVMHPRTWATLRELTDADNRPLLQPDPSTAANRVLFGVPVYLTSQISVTETQGTNTASSSVYVYDARQVVAVQREDARVERDSSRLFDYDQTEVRAIVRYALAVPNPTAVVRIKGVTV